MSQSVTIEKLRREREKITKELNILEVQKKEIDDKLQSVLKEEETLLDRMRRCRDPYEYNKIDVRLNTISRSRRQIEAKKEEIERRIRGYKEELTRIEKRIGYLTPKK